ncbi:MAG: hypothetical protein U1E39_08385 [Planctomycetota bacterium]
MAYAVRRSWGGVLVAGLVVGAWVGAARGPARAADAPAPEPLVPTATIPLGDVAGRIDHLALDAEGQRLAVAALAHGAVVIVDPAERKVVHVIEGLAEPQGVAWRPDGRLLVTTGGDGRLRLVDATTAARLDEVEVGDDADNVRLLGERVFVGAGAGWIAEVTSAAEVLPQAGAGLRAREVLASKPSVRLGGHPESFQVEVRKHVVRAYVNVPGTVAQVAVLEGTGVLDRLVATWTLAGVAANYPMALDASGHRLFVGCRRPARLLVLDTETGATTATSDLSGDVDDLWWDETASRLYASCGEGFVDVFAPTGEAWTRTHRVATRKGARTSLFVPGTRTLFVAVPRLGDEPAEVRVFSAR